MGDSDDSIYSQFLVSYGYAEGFKRGLLLGATAGGIAVAIVTVIYVSMM